MIVNPEFLNVYFSPSVQKHEGKNLRTTVFKSVASFLWVRLICFCTEVMCVWTAKQYSELEEGENETPFLFLFCTNCDQLPIAAANAASSFGATPSALWDWKIPVVKIKISGELTQTLTRKHWKQHIQAHAANKHGCLSCRNKPSHKFRHKAISTVNNAERSNVYLKFTCLD